MAVAGLYKRTLPSPPAIEFSSSEGKQLFFEALQAGTMEGFFKLISYFQTQAEPAYCGLASLSVVLNALAIDPGRKWKGPWRWFDESMLDCCEPLEKMKAEGTTFATVICLARCAGARVEAFHTSQSTISDFRKHVIRCVSSEDCHLITSYDRRAFKQTGTGHFSPIGGYHADKDMALILDVARFKYPPHWVPLTLLWEAMDTFDRVTGRTRGFMLLSRSQDAPSQLYTLSCRHENCINTANYLMVEAPELLKAEGLSTVSEVLSTIFASLPVTAGDFIKWIVEVRRKEEDGGNLSKEERARLSAKEDVLQQVRETELFKHVTKWLSSGSPCCLSLQASHDKYSLPALAASVCCQGARLLTGAGTTREFCCSSMHMDSFESKGENHDIPMKVISSTVVFNGNEQGVDMLVPVSPRKLTSECNACLSACNKMHPEVTDALTVLLFALPPNAWSGIKNKDLLKEIYDLVSTDGLPEIVHVEVLHLRRQLCCLYKLMRNEAYSNLDLPTTN